MMKRLVLIFCVLGFVSLSQAQTPTKQQAVNELNNQEWEVSYRNYYDSYTRGVTRGHYQTVGRQDQKNNQILSKTSFAMKDNSCVLEVTINYQEAEDYDKAKNAPIQTKTIEIDMSKVIRIESRLAIVDALMGFDTSGIGHFDRGWILMFVLVDENFKETKKIELLQFNSGFNTNNDFYQMAEDLKATKPYKVLNHLRKLCNAPEPLSWD